MTLHVYLLALLIYGDIAPVTALCTRPKTLELRFNVIYYTVFLEQRLALITLEN